MVYVEPSEIGWEPLLTSWIKTLPACLEPHVDKLRNLFGWLVPPCLRFVRKECKSMVTVGITETDEITKVKAMMCLMEALWVVLKEDEEKGAQVAKQLPLWIENIFVFSLVWSIAGIIDGPSRPKFDQFFRQICTAKAPRGYEKVDGVFGEQVMFEKFFPEEATVFEYTFSLQKHNWITWMDTIAKEDTVIPPDAEFSSIIVPTLDTARYTSLLETLLTHNVPLLYVGPTGTGKTAYVQKHVLKLPSDAWASIFLNFSAQTSANQSQDIVDSKLDKRRKGVFGPPMGKRTVIFVDDLNMPALETYGAQPVRARKGAWNPGPADTTPVQ
jgi:dynein heavy chain